MKSLLFNILNQYLEIFPEEKEKQEKFIKYLQNHQDQEITDWNNFDGHIVASGFIYAQKEKKFLLVYHKDLKMYLCSGGHVDPNDKTPLEAAKREIKEETGLKHLKVIKITSNELVPIDMNTHRIAYNERLNLPEHDHFAFIYFFTIEKISDIAIDEEELSDYQWINMNELISKPHFCNLLKKVKKVLVDKL